METIETLGKYEIKRTLGRGAMGTVYEGWDPIIARRVAIKTVKIINAEDAETEEQLARFRREAQAAGRLTHPNIVGVFDYGESNDVAYIVMEFVDGPSVKSLLDKQERFAQPDIMRIMEDLLAGLQFSHERGVVHRDIKPANLMLTSAGQAKIADFGIARIESSSMTQAGTVLGTPAYMSPEQFMGEVVDARSDLYSSGVLLYQLLTGERPFEGGLSAIMHKVMNTEPPAPSQIAVTCPMAFDTVVRKAMARRPEDRFQSATEFLQALRAAATGGRNEEPADPADEATMVVPSIAASASSAPARAETATGHPAKKRSALPLVLAGLLVLVLAAGGGAWVFLKRGPTTIQRGPIQTGPIQTAATARGTAPASAPPAVGNTAPAAPAKAAPTPDHATQRQAGTATPQPTAPTPQATPATPPAPAAAGTGQAANTAESHTAESHTAGTHTGTIPPSAPAPASNPPVEPPSSSVQKQQAAATAPGSGQQPGLPSQPATPSPPPALPRQATAPPQPGSTAQTAAAAQPAEPPPSQQQAAAAPAPAAAPSRPGKPSTAPTPAGSTTPAGAPKAESQVASVGLGAVRRQLAQVISSQSCSVLSGSVQDSGTIALDGLAGTYAADSVRQALAGRAVDWQVTSVDPYYCPALDVVHPISTGTGIIGSQLGLTLATGKAPLRDGQRILPQLVMPDFRGYLRVDYVTHDGAVMHLYPQVADPSQRIAGDPRHAIAAGTTVKLGRPSPGHPEWLVGEPYGTDMIIAVASNRPLFTKSRPGNVESAGTYLAALQHAVDAARRDGDRLAGNAITVETLPKK